LHKFQANLNLVHQTNKIYPSSNSMLNINIEY